MSPLPTAAQLLGQPVHVGEEEFHHVVEQPLASSLGLCQVESGGHLTVRLAAVTEAGSFRRLAQIIAVHVYPCDGLIASGGDPGTMQRMVARGAPTGSGVSNPQSLIPNP